jgi:hypothetical protein
VAAARAEAAAEAAELRAEAARAEGASLVRPVTQPGHVQCAVYDSLSARQPLLRAVAVGRGGGAKGRASDDVAGLRRTRRGDAADRAAAGRISYLAAGRTSAGLADADPHSRGPAAALCMALCVSERGVKQHAWTLTLFTKPKCPLSGLGCGSM